MSGLSPILVSALEVVPQIESDLRTYECYVTRN